LDELELVNGLRERREDAVRAFVERYRSLFLHCISGLESDSTAREDLFQELVWHALERLDRDRFDPQRGSFGTWLYRVAWCRCVDLKRQQQGRRKPRLTVGVEQMPERTDPRPGPSDQLSSAELGDLVRAAMAELEPQDRHLLEMRFVDELTLLDMAQRESLTLEQAKYRIRRAMAGLRAALLRLAPRQEVAE
jgi:RNA polymerase sigma-70 factor (ECF subfamily)